MMKSNCSMDFDIKEILTKLKLFSKNLNRNFLFLVVRISSQLLNVKTTRNDWRTKNGMLRFLKNYWNLVEPLLYSNSFLSWFCRIYNFLEILFNEKKFVMYLFYKWEELSFFFTSFECEMFLKYNQHEIKKFLLNFNNIPLNCNNNIEIQIIDIIKKYHKPNEISISFDNSFDFEFDMNFQSELELI